ncbi:phosphatase PAP2 family protein [Actinomadura madurae]|nr:phosphatase PAP2 family protein [Actinomadura madurae]MCQ0012559.1 phosphatase PAP2 family protein [Actinomadura madurae]
MNRSGAVASGAEDGDAGRAASAAREIAAALAVLVVYLVFTHAFSGDRAASDAHGRALLDFERWARLDAERPLNDLLVRHEWLGAVAAWEYATTYVIGTFGLLAYLWWTRNPAYAWARNTLILVTLIAICCFAVWPTTPPRLLPGEGYTDVIAIHHPPATWGTTVVSAGANPYAAMPSLHIGWVAWIGVAAVRARCGALLAWLCALHLVVTGLVIVATAAHYVVDIPGGLLLVPAAAGVERLRAGLAPGRRPPDAAPGAGPGREQRVAAADAFFLHVESAEVPQVVGGVAEFAGPGPSAERVRALMAERLPDLPRLTQRISSGGVLRPAALGGRRPRRPARARPGGGPAVAGRAPRPGRPRRPPRHRAARPRPAALAVLDRARRGVRPGRGRHPPPPRHRGRDRRRRHPARHPRTAAPGGGPGARAREPRPRRRRPARPRPARARRPGADRVGHRDARPGPRVRHRHAAARRGPGRGPRGRRPRHRRAPRADRRGRRGGAGGARRAGGRRPLRAAVPMTLRAPAPPGRGRTAVPGNLTAALRLDVPVAPMPVRDRLAAVHEAAERRRRSGRAVASTAAMRLMGALPPPLHARAARGTYRGRFFGGIVSNMPGPPLPMSLAGAPLGDVHPILPLADGVPFAVGALSWNGSLHVSVTAEPRVLPEAARFPDALLRAFERLAAEVGAGSGAQSGTA